MKHSRPATEVSPAGREARIDELARQISAAEAELQVVAGGQTDAIVDHAGQPILLRQAQAALRASEARYQGLVSQMSAKVFEVDPAGVITFVNDAATAILGYRPAELIGRDYRDIFGSDLDRSAPLEDLRAQRSLGVSRFEVTLPAKDGAPRRLELDLMDRHAAAGNVVGISGFAIDRTDRYRAEQALQETLAGLETRVRERTAELADANAALLMEVSERKKAEGALRVEEGFVSTILDTADALVLVLDRDGHIVSFNRACEELTGYTLAEVRGRPLWDAVILPDEADRVRARFPTVVAGAFPEQLENHWVTRDGRRRLIAFRNKSLRGPGGAVSHIVAVGIDVTEQRQVEAERERLLAELQARTEQLEALREVGLQLAGELDLDALLRSVVSWATGLLGVDQGALFLLRADGDALQLAAAVGFEPALTGTSLRRGEGIAGRVWQCGEMIVVDDQQSWPSASPILNGEAASVAATPICFGDTFLGVLEVTARQLRAFSAAEQNLLQLLAGQAAIAIRNARLVAEQTRQREEVAALLEIVQRRTSQLDAVRETSLQMAVELDLPPLLQSIVSRAMALLRAESGTILLYCPELDALEHVASANMSPELRGRIVHRGEGLTGKVWETGAPLVLDDFRSWPGRSQRLWPDPAAVAVVGVPIRWGDEFLGVLSLQHSTAGVFGPADAELVALFATQAALAIRNARFVAEQAGQRQEIGALAESLQQRTAQLEAVREVGLQLSSELHLDALLNRIVAQAVALCATDTGGLFLVRPERGVLELAAVVNEDPKWIGFVLQPGEGVAGTIWQSGAPLIVEDYGSWPGRSPRYPSRLGAAVVGVPIRWGDDILGVLSVTSHRAGALGATEAEILTLVAGQAATAIRNARLLAEQAEQREAMSALAYALHLERDTLDAIMDNTRTCLAYLDPQFNFVKANSAYVQGCGHTREELIGHYHFALFPNEENQSIFEEVRATGLPATFLAKPFVYADQPERGVTYWDWSLVPVKDRLGELQGFVFSLLDVTENEEARRELQRRTAQLEALREVGLRLSAELDVEALLHAVVAQAVRMFGADAGGIDLYRPERDLLEWAVSVGLNPALDGAVAVRGEGLAGQVWATGAPLIVNDYQHWAGRASAFVGAPVESALGVPVRWGDEFLGVLEVLHSTLRPFSAADVEMLTLLATQAAVAIRNARLVAQQAEQRRRAEALVRATAALASSLELEPLLENLLEAAMQAIPAAERGAVFLLDEDSGGLRLRAQIGFDEFQLERARFAPGRPEMLWRVLHGASMLLPNLGEYLDEHAHVGAAYEIGRAAVVAPLRYRDRPIGVVVITSLSGEHNFTESDLILLTSFAEQGAVAVDNSRLYAEAQGKATLEERQRLARALHDSVTQSLYSLTLFTQAALEWSQAGKQERVHGNLLRIGEVAQQSLKDMRLLVYQLRPTILEKEGLVAALQHRLNAVEKRAGVGALVIADDLSELPASTEEALYYIAQEALNNSLKYAGASSIRVLLQRDAGQVELTVTDDGRGFDLDAVGDKGGLGLQSMKERAERDGGSLTVVTAAGRGTRIVVRMNLPNA